MSNNKQIFFQSSLPRSGSTLLQNIIGQNPNFYVTPTSGVLELVFAARHNYAESLEFKAQDSKKMENGFRGFCKYGLLGYYHSITDKPYVIDKSRGWGYYQDFLEFFYPEPKIICMLRDPRSIFASMEKIHRKNPQIASGVVNDFEMTGITIEQRVAIWGSSQPVGLAFQRLYDIIKKANDKKMLFVKFEHLTSNPQLELNRIYNYLGVEPYAHDFSNVQQITVEDDSVYGQFGDHKIKNKVELPTEDYNEILGHQLADNIKQSYQWFYDYFNY